MKRHRLSLFLVGLLFITSVVGLFSVKGLAQSDLNYTFQNDNLFNSTGLGRQSWVDDTPKNFNIRQRKSINITQTYNATYSFTDEVVGTQGTAIDFIDLNDGADGVSEIIALKRGHENVLQYTALLAWNKIEHHFTEQASNSIELWIMTEQVDITSIIRIKDAIDGNAIYLEFRDDGEIEYNDGGYHNIQSYIADTWYHLKFEWDCTTHWHLTINGLIYGEFDYLGTPIALDKFEIIANVDSILNIDGYGEYWDPNYTSGDNLIFYTKTIENEYEVDKWEFRHNPNTRTQYVDGFDDPSGWSDYLDNEPTIDNVNTLNIGGDKDIVVHIDDFGGLFRGFGNIDDSYYNITYNIGINQLDDDDVGANAIVINIKDGADIIASVYLRNTGQAEIFHDSGSTILGAFDITNDYTISFLINFESKAFTYIMSYWENGTELYNFVGGFYDPSVSVIDGIIYYHICTGGDVVDSDIFSISVYNTTGSISDDVGELRWDDVGYEFPDQLIWDFTEFNLINLESNFQNFSLFHEALGGLSFKNLIYWNTENIDFVNIYESYSIDGLDVQLRLWMYHNFSFNSISIDGVKLVQGSNKYPLIYTHGNIDITESYFYVDSSNNLRGQCFYNDSNLEFIQANFDIENVLNENRSLRFRSRFSGQYGFFSLSYIDATGSTIPLSVLGEAHNLILPQAKTIDEFVFLISDDDNLEAGYGSGVIYNIKLIWNPSISITIVTISLIMVMIPIIIMVVPTLLVYSKYGKSFIMPVFIFMSIICFAGGLIPAWLFFILMVGAGGFLVLKKGSDE